MEAIDLNSVIDQLKGWGRAATHAVMDAPRELYNTAVDQVMPKVTSFAQDISRVAEEGHDNTVRANTKARVPGQYIDPAIGAVIADVVASRLKAPQPVQQVTHSMATEPTSSVDLAGSVVGPFKGMGKLVPRLAEGEIGPLYHMTSADRLAQIIKDGVIKASTTVPANYVGSQYPRQAGVYLSRFAGDLVDRLNIPGKPVVIKIPSLPVNKMLADEDVMNIMSTPELRAYNNVAKKGGQSILEALPYRRSARLAPDQQDDIYRLLDSLGGDSLPLLMSQDSMAPRYGLGTMAHAGDINLASLSKSPTFLTKPAQMMEEDEQLKTLLARLIQSTGKQSIDGLPWWLR